MRNKYTARTVTEIASSSSSRLLAKRYTDWSSAVACVAMPLTLVDLTARDEPILHANQAFLDLTGYTLDQVIGRNCRFLQGPETDRTTVARIRQALRNRQEIEVEILNYRSNGAAFWNSVLLSPIRDDGGTPVGYFGVQRDVSDRRRHGAQRGPDNWDSYGALKRRRSLTGVGSAPEKIQVADVMRGRSRHHVHAASLGAHAGAELEAEIEKLLRDSQDLQIDLRSAVTDGKLDLHYQPQAVIQGDIVGFEALARWHHPTRGAIPPSTFVPLAEESGLIVEMGEWVLRKACKDAAAWSRPLQVAVNLSPVQFRDDDLVTLVCSALVDSGLAPNRLELEITEGVLIDDFSRVVSMLRRLKALGVRIAMDDFGTGYSSLLYLQSFPFDKIKIDRAFISNLDSCPQSKSIVRAMIALGRSLELVVAAEGVATEAQLSFVRSEGGHEVQGYLIGHPLPIERYLRLVGDPGTTPRS